MKFYTPYNAKERETVFATFNNEPDLAQQSDSRETDINFIVNTYAKTGQMPQRVEPAQYGDFSEITDFRDALERVNAAKEMFAGIPAKIRKEFDNDPGRFLAFANNPANAEKLVEYGLANKKQTESPAPATTPETKE
ncbi:MAG: internal scaffolding protein [Arizlama microvirus]|nr:MAG: internal scaffolding protein [Arizlama microvirus]